MGRWDRWLPQMMAAVITAAGVIGAPSASTGKVPTSGAPTSYYVVPTGPSGNGSSADSLGYQAGCNDGRSGVAGLRVLFYGTQESDGRIRPPGTSAKSPVARVDEQWVQHASVGWIRGFTQCGRANAVLAIGVNNKADGGVDAASSGASWARLVERIAASAPLDRVAVTGALDGEPSWSTAKWARQWVGSYVSSTRRLLYAANSADGCPQSGAKTTCGNGWTVADVHYVSTGAASNVVALPQIYRTDGAQARQWAYVSQWGQQSGAGPLRIVGVLSQQSACQQRSGCSGTSNSPTVARRQLSEALEANGQSGTGGLVVTDMKWLGTPPEA